MPPSLPVYVKPEAALKVSVDPSPASSDRFFPLKRPSDMVAVIPNGPLTDMLLVVMAQ